MATPTDPALPQFPGARGVNDDYLVPTFRADSPTRSVTTVGRLRTAFREIVPSVVVLSETFALGDFTDEGDNTGTATFSSSLPIGALILGLKVTVEAGFDGDTSATMQLGDGSDVDRYMTGTPSVYADAATGLEVGPPSGTRLLTAANPPTLTVTTAADFTSVTQGDVTIRIYYLMTAAV